MCFRISEEEARKRWTKGRLRIAAIGAIEKADNSFRIIHDGTHGVRVNNQSIVRDRLRMPGPKEEKAIMRRASQKQGPYFSLQADVSKAHRRFIHRKADWGAPRMQSRMWRTLDQQSWHVRHRIRRLLVGQTCLHHSQM